MWTESNTPSKIEGAGGADVPKALIYRNAIRETLFPELVFIRPERTGRTLWKLTPSKSQYLLNE
jgi:hypothetical protein